jgi:predicted secreted acid phosphatase
MMSQSSAPGRMAVTAGGACGRRRTSVICTLALSLGLCCAAACASSRAVPSLFAAQGRVEHYIDSGQYDKDFAAVVARAKAYMEKRAAVVSKPAIVLDIDETSLSNWPAYRVNGWVRIAAGQCDLKQGPCGIRAWQAMAASKALVPTLELAKRAEAIGVAVFFITGRPSDLRDATERNLRQEGYRFAGLVLMPEGASFKSAVDFKAPERRKIAEQGYAIILSMGDQESDLRGGYAEKTFKLPNPVYFLP